MLKSGAAILPGVSPKVSSGLCDPVKGKNRTNSIEIYNQKQVPSIKKLTLNTHKKNWKNLRLLPTLESLPSTMSASLSSFPVENPLAEKNLSNDLQVTELDTRSNPLLMKWPLSLTVDGSSPNARAMEPKSSLWSSHATTWTSFDADGHNSFIVLGLHIE